MPNTGLPGVKSRCQEGCIPSGGSRSASIASLFSGSGSSRIPWCVASSFIFNVGQVFLTPAL